MIFTLAKELVWMSVNMFLTSSWQTAIRDCVNIDMHMRLISAQRCRFNQKYFFSTGGDFIEESSTNFSTCVGKLKIRLTLSTGRVKSRTFLCLTSICLFNCNTYTSGSDLLILIFRLFTLIHWLLSNQVTYLKSMSEKINDKWCRAKFRRKTSF